MQLLQQNRKRMSCKSILESCTRNQYISLARAALMDVLEKKGVLTSGEWEKEVKSKVETAAKTTQSFREIES